MAKLKRDDRAWVRQIATEVKTDARAPGAEVYLYTNAAGKPCAMGFKTAKTAKKDFHHVYGDLASRDYRLKEWFDLRAYDHAQKVKEEQAKASAKESFVPEVGSIWVYTWGYDQTNRDFYQLTEVKGKSTVVLRPIQSKTVRGNAEGFSDPNMSMAGYVEPVKDAFKGTSFYVKRVGFGYRGHPVIKMDHGHALPWDGTPKYESYHG